LVAGQLFEEFARPMPPAWALPSRASSRAMGGDVTVKSKSGKVSVFTVRLPGGCDGTLESGSEVFIATIAKSQFSAHTTLVQATIREMRPSR
jgi:hypothetical protein